jgi:hypothetical protein
MMEFSRAESHESVGYLLLRISICLRHQKCRIEIEFLNIILNDRLETRPTVSNPIM